MKIVSGGIYKIPTAIIAPVRCHLNQLVAHERTVSPEPVESISLAISPPAKRFLYQVSEAKQARLAPPKIPPESLLDVLDMALTYMMPEVTAQAMRVLARRVVAGDDDLASVLSYFVTPCMYRPETNQFLTHVAQTYFNLCDNDPRIELFYKMWNACLQRFSKQLEESTATLDGSPPINLGDVRQHFIDACSAGANNTNPEPLMLAISLLASSPRPDDVTAGLALFKQLQAISNGPKDHSATTTTFIASVLSAMMWRPDVALHADTWFEHLPGALEKLPNLALGVINSGLLPYLDIANQKATWKAAFRELRPAVKDLEPDDHPVIRALRYATLVPNKAHVALEVALADLNNPNNGAAALNALCHIAEFLHPEDVSLAWAALITFTKKTAAWHFEDPRSLAAFGALFNAANTKTRAQWITEVTALSVEMNADIRAVSWSILATLAQKLSEVEWRTIWHNAAARACQIAVLDEERQSAVNLLATRLPHLTRKEKSTLFTAASAELEPLERMGAGTELFAFAYQMLPKLEPSALPGAFDALSKVWRSYGSKRPKNLSPSFPQASWNAMLKAVEGGMHEVPLESSLAWETLKHLAAQVQGDAALQMWDVLRRVNTGGNDPDRVVLSARFAQHLNYSATSTILQRTLELAGSENIEEVREAVRTLLALVRNLDTKGIQKVVDRLIPILNTYGPDYARSVGVSDVLSSCCEGASAGNIMPLWKALTELAQNRREFSEEYLDSGLQTLVRRGRLHELCYNWLRNMAADPVESANRASAYHAAHLILSAPQSIVDAIIVALPELLNEEEKREFFFEQFLYLTPGAAHPDRRLSILASLSNDVSEIGAAARFYIKKIVYDVPLLPLGEITEYLSHSQPSLQDMASEALSHFIETMEQDDLEEVEALVNNLESGHSKNIILAKFKARQDAIAQIGLLKTYQVSARFSLT